MTKKKTSVSLDEETLEWIKKKVEERRFASISHAVQYALKQLMEKERMGEG